MWEHDCGIVPVVDHAGKIGGVPAEGSFPETLMRTFLVVLPVLTACTSGYMQDAVPTGPPGPDESKVIVYRTSIIGSLGTYPVYDGEKLVGLTEKGKYFEVRCAPGKHVFISGYVPFAAGGVEADLAPGKTYYIKSYPRASLFWSVVGGLAPVTRESKEWARIEKRLQRMQCRELTPESAMEFAKSDTPSAVRYRIEHSKPFSEILAQEDGK
jgi:hypothetical protein